MTRSPSTQVNELAGSKLWRGGRDRLGLPLRGRGDRRDRIRQRAQVSHARRLEDVGRDALATRERTVELEEHAHLAERVAAAGDGADVVLLEPRFVASRG